MTTRETLMGLMADEIRSACEAVTDVDVQVEPYMILNPTPPSVDIYPASFSRDSSTAGFGEIDGAYRLTVRARVSTADSDAGQNLLLAFSDDENALCLPALLYDSLLGGYAADVAVTEQTGFRLYEHPSGEGAYLGFEFTATVIPAES